ncbi:MAG: hypothetical protein M1820_009351 [Bogoriella megaspora]|nr:MAG: hypothetical protein M1820_009351 [Bogoriella megaspora]
MLTLSPDDSLTRPSMAPSIYVQHRTIEEPPAASERSFDSPAETEELLWKSGISIGPKLLASGFLEEKLPIDKRGEGDSAVASTTTETTTMVAQQEAEGDANNVPRTVVEHEAEASQRKNEEQALGTRQLPRQETTARPATAGQVQHRRQEQAARPATASHFRGISTVIPTSTLEDLSEIGSLQFSHRGSILIKNRRREEESSSTTPAGAPRTRRKPSVHRLEQLESTNSRFLSADDVMLSQKVRSMYESGSENNVTVSSRPQTAVPAAPGILPQLRPQGPEVRSPARPSSRVSTSFPREEHETAGGMEDWEDIEGGEVDRYGFIHQNRPNSNGSKNSTPERPKMQRISTSLFKASQTPRRKRTIRRGPTNATSQQPRNGRLTMQRNRSQRSLRPPSSMNSRESGSSRASTLSRYRIATNKLPQNRDRRTIDEAGDMLTLRPGLPDIEEERESNQVAYEMKAKEWSRGEKWRKMAKNHSSGPKGGGMVFDFDTRNPKLISRTWKGIPDRWRASAWHAFLSASMRKRKFGESEEELVEKYYVLQEENSKDDMQIDTDVPRTISDHVMFRKRYRGGQRLLFRVLHALSLYFPETGYVQGMASIAAMFLNYYDEEQTFVMLVRVWQLRGLEELYKPGFDGLMSALADFEKKWLAHGDVARKLDELGISSTAYGTRWYLTLFNVSIPFPAQLRVWDVFLLLGDGPINPESGSADLDVLHATSMALIDATREILLDSDFENAMKTLTSQIPVRDEDILMRVAKTEYKAKKKRAA